MQSSDVFINNIDIACYSCAYLCIFVWLHLAHVHIYVFLYDFILLRFEMPLDKRFDFSGVRDADPAQMAM